MSIDATQRSATRNQSTVDYLVQNMFLGDNRYQTGTFVNNTGASFDAKDGYLVVRAAGSYETASVAFSATSLSAGQTVILAGLTYTSTGTTTRAQLAAAFANLSAGATTGGGTGTGTYSGTLTGYNTGDVLNGSTVVFTATTVGNKTDLAQTGTGASATITVVNGADGTTNGFAPATSANLANIIGILRIDGTVTLADAGTVDCNYCIEGDIDSSMINFPAGVTLNTIVGNKNLRDVLTALGFCLYNVSEGSKFDN